MAGALAAGLALTADSRATNPLLGELDPSERAELVQWATHYWDRVDNGNKLSENEFTFANPLMNSPLFMPVRGVRKTLEHVGIVDAAACDGLIDLNPGSGDATLADALRLAMLEWKVATDTVENPTGTGIHMNLILASPGTSFIMNGLDLESTDLPWLAIDTPVQTATIAGSLSPQTLDAIEKLVEVGPIIAAASAGITESQKLLTGLESHADRFLRGIETTLDSGVGFGTAWRVDATFGVFGSLPLVGVTFDDCFVLIDTINGAVDGPFDLESALDASVLLGAHDGEYVPATAVRYSTVGGCTATVTKKWRPTPPAAPKRPVPAVPGPPAVPEGGGGIWSCTEMRPAGTCRCSRDELWDNGPGGPGTPFVVKRRCTYDENYPPVVGCGQPGSTPVTTPPGIAPPTHGPNGPGPTCEWFY